MKQSCVTGDQIACHKWQVDSVVPVHKYGMIRIVYGLDLWSVGVRQYVVQSIATPVGTGKDTKAAVFPRSIA